MNIDGLRELGANVDEGLERCMGMEDFYMEMIELGLSDERFETLGQALEAGDLDNSFEHVHALKGVIGNLALTPLYETICEITEHLRAREQMDYKPLYEKLISQRNAFRS
ncbi:Hpt domain-containing protein [Butyrivibrio sp. XPD2002]|jgi:HPt (histidine-containing phosphotransfer) domain-containing protein|uniref:Hpt domain-containing protein n=1 Tax=Butyrivibrio sp. XPD2002 TaxID=1280665 RepID=UPI0004041BEA|nr:Hpt domain-containing protein [Butyrivibrio sp. XPD2002]MCR5342328.1 Hpt domain-containing protein [Butyrivibrio sp.]